MNFINRLRKDSISFADLLGKNSANFKNGFRKQNPTKFIKQMRDKNSELCQKIAEAMNKLFFTQLRKNIQHLSNCHGKISQILPVCLRKASRISINGEEYKIVNFVYR